MTAHDYPGETNTATDPGYQRQADEYAASRGERAGARPSPVHADSAISTAGGPESLDDDPRSSTQSSTDTSLFADAELAELRRGWDSVQAGFVDDPKRCVEQADALVSEVVKQLSSGFAEARSRLEQQWSRGEDASTEDLRVALKRYREFFDRLLAV